jgi:hypothetical protein
MYKKADGSSFMPRRPCRITATGTDQFPSSSLTVTATETTLQPNWFPHRPPRDNVHLSAPFFFFCFVRRNDVSFFLATEISL